MLVPRINKVLLTDFGLGVNVVWERYRALFVHHALSSAINPRRGSQNNSLHLAGGTCSQQVHCSDFIDVYAVIRVRNSHAYIRDGREMMHNFNVFAGQQYIVLVEQVTTEPFNLLSVWFDLIKHSYIVSFLHQFFHHVAADETRSSCYKDHHSSSPKTLIPHLLFVE